MAAGTTDGGRPTWGERPAARRGRRRALAVVLVLLAGAGAVVLVRPGPDPMRLLAAATAEYTAGRLDRAEALLNRRARRAAPTALDWILRARIAEGRDRFDEAVAALRNVPDADPFAAQRWLLEGQIELNRDRARTAEAALRRALALDPKLAVAHRELSYIYAMQHRQNECDAEFRALGGLAALDYKLAFVWCQNACDIWDPKETGARLAKFLGADPDDRASRLALALSHQRDGHPEAAEPVLAPLPESDVDARALRAQIALDRDDVTTAARLAAANPPDHPATNVLRGRLALGRRDAAAAARDFRAALAAEPDNRDALNGLGQALRMGGDHAAAESYLDQARRRDALKRLILDAHFKLQSDPKLFSRLAALCEAVPLPRQATLWYRLAIELDPLDADAQKALARLPRPS